MEDNRQEVARLIERFISGDGDPWEWDDFISVRHSDPMIEGAREKCAKLPEHFPPKTRMEYCSEEGIKVLADLAKRLSSD